MLWETCIIWLQILVEFYVFYKFILNQCVSQDAYRCKTCTLDLELFSYIPSSSEIFEEGFLCVCVCAALSTLKAAGYRWFIKCKQ